MSASTPQQPEPSSSPESGTPPPPAPGGPAKGAPASGAASAQPGEAEQEKPRTPLTQQIGRVVVVLLVVVFAVFAVTNSQPVDFSWLVGETTATFDQAGEHVGGGVPLIALMLASLAVGFALGALIVWQVGRSRRRAKAAETAKVKDEAKRTRRSRS